MALSDIERVVIPPLMTGQFAILDTQIDGQAIPVALALWASVSPEVNAKLSDLTILSLRLRPDEWRSGEILWLIEILGEHSAVPHLLMRLHHQLMDGRELKMRWISPDGTARVTTLGELINSEEQSS